MNLLLRLTVLLFLSGHASGATYLAPDDFVARSFDVRPEVKTLWLNQEYQSTAKQVLGHPYQGLRIRYWRAGDRTLWILDEIGKEKPITIGVVIDGAEIARVAILEFRESRGGEVRHPFFTRQFRHLELQDDLGLSGNIDGISGATLSVKAVTNIARFALYLHNDIVSDNDA